MADATVMIVRDEAGERCVVTRADPEIWLTEELWAEISDPDRRRITGDAELNGDVLTFGTDGEGMGRLTYRRTGRHVDPYGHHRWIVCERVERG